MTEATQQGDDGDPDDGFDYAGLEADLAELERTDPDVGEAAARVDAAWDRFQRTRPDRTSS